VTKIEDIITQSFREAGTVIIGNTPTTDEVGEATPLLSSFIQSFFGYDIGVQMTNWPVPPSSTSPVYSRYPLGPLNEELPNDVWPYPPSNVSLLVGLSSPTTVYLPPAPQDGARVGVIDMTSTANLTLEGNGRLIQGAKSITDTAPGSLNGKTWFYRADLANWIELKSSYVGTDDSPLPADLDDLLICGFAIRLSGRYNNAPRDSTLAVYRKFLEIARTRYQQVVREPLSEEAEALSTRIYRTGGTSNIVTGGP
jgi:hypothetical protein